MKTPSVEMPDRLLARVASKSIAAIIPMEQVEFRTDTPRDHPAMSMITSEPGGSAYVANVRRTLSIDQSTVIGP